MIGVKLKQKKLPIFIEQKFVVVLDLNQIINQRVNNNYFYENKILIQLKEK